MEVSWKFYGRIISAVFWIKRKQYKILKSFHDLQKVLKNKVSNKTNPNAMATDLS